eukprot:3878337-Pyramimonas_sp.AAC.1
MDPNTHADPASGAFGRAPYGATKCVRGVPRWTRVRMRTLPLEPSVELPMGPCHWSLQWSSLWGREA